MLEFLKKAQSDMQQAIDAARAEGAGGAGAASPTGEAASSAAEAEPAHDHAQTLAERPRMFASGHIAAAAMRAQFSQFLGDEEARPAALVGASAGSAGSAESPDAAVRIALGEDFAGGVAFDTIAWDRPEIALNQITQIDDDQGTIADAHRCGAAVIGAGLMLTGPEATDAAVAKVRGRLEEMQTELRALPDQAAADAAAAGRSAFPSAANSSGMIGRIAAPMFEQQLERASEAARAATAGADGYNAREEALAHGLSMLDGLPPAEEWTVEHMHRFQEALYTSMRVDYDVFVRPDVHSTPEISINNLPGVVVREYRDLLWTQDGPGPNERTRIQPTYTLDGADIAVDLVMRRDGHFVLASGSATAQDAGNARVLYDPWPEAEGNGAGSAYSAAADGGTVTLTPNASAGATSANEYVDLDHFPPMRRLSAAERAILERETRITP